MSEQSGDFSLDLIKKLIGEAYKHSPNVKRQVDKILNSRMAPGGKKGVTEIVDGKQIKRYVGTRKNKFMRR